MISEHWSPRIVGECNDHQIKLAKIKDEFIWHSHANEDEVFIVYKGTLIMDFVDKTRIIKEHEFLVIPKGVKHRPRTNGEEVWIMLIEPKDIKHTGDIDHEKTVKNFGWL